MSMCFFYHNKQRFSMVGFFKDHDPAVSGIDTGILWAHGSRTSPNRLQGDPTNTWGGFLCVLKLLDFRNPAV